MSFTKKKQVFKPHPYQKKGIQFILKKVIGALFYDPGLGKTATVLKAVLELFEKEKVGCVLVIAPLNVIYNVWPFEIKKWGFDLTYTILHGRKKDKHLLEGVDIYLINPEGLKWYAEAVDKDYIPDMLVVDESTIFSNASSKRFGILKKLLGAFSRRYILTGTPRPKSLMGLFSQIYILDKGRAFSPYIGRFRNEYFNVLKIHKDNYEIPIYTPMDDAETRIIKKIAPYSMRLDEKDYLKLPDKITTDIYISAPDNKDFTKIYNTLHKDYVYEIAQGVDVYASGGVLVNKLRQLTGGFLIDDQKRVHHLHDHKADELVNLMRELNGKPTLVAYQYRHEREYLQKKLGKDEKGNLIPYIGGGVSSKQVTKLIKQWNAGEIDRLLVHPQSLSYGLNMQETGRAIVWYSITWSWEDYDQLVRRIFRQGQKEKVFVYHLVMRDTVDEDILTRLADRKRDQNLFLDQLKIKYID